MKLKIESNAGSGESKRRIGGIKMEFAAGVWETKDVEFARLWKEEAAGQEAETAGMIHSIRDMGEISFVILRSRQGLLQAVREGAGQQGDLSRLKEGQAVRVRGVLKKEPKAPHGMELRLSDARILSEPAAPLPLPVGKWEFPWRPAWITGPLH